MGASIELGIDLHLRESCFQAGTDSSQQHLALHSAYTPFHRSKIMHPILRPFAVAALALSVAACGTLDRPDGPLRLYGPDSVVSAAMARTSIESQVTDFNADFSYLLSRESPPRLLALSGGGANGAYGAGLIYGWSEAGTRPSFDIVTGISTGALAAPFAFLGPEWDEELREAYTGKQTESLIGLRSFAAIFNPSLFSSKQLERLVDSYVTFELLRAIAHEHANGRRLMVATTNLDTQQSVIWDIGVIATRGDEDARQLFKKILVASASIPGVFPPVLLPGLSPEGQPIAEMHVDGGVNLPYLAIPEELMLWTSSRARPGRGAIYIIVNGQTGRNTGTTPGRLTGILGRTYDSMSKASLRTHLAVTSGFASRNGLEMSFTAIPDNVQASALSFDQVSMTALFEVGRQRGRDGSAWRRMDKIDPAAGLIGEDKIDEADIPEPLLLKPVIPPSQTPVTPPSPTETPYTPQP